MRRTALRLGLEPSDGALFALMAAEVAVLVCAFTMAKVLRDSLFLREFGALALPYAYVAVAIGSAGYLALENRLARRLAYADASVWITASAMGAAAVAAVALPHAPSWTAAAFFVWTGSQVTSLLPRFWAQALDAFKKMAEQTSVKEEQ